MPLVPVATQRKSPHNTGAYFGPAQKKKAQKKKSQKPPVKSQIPATKKSYNAAKEKKGFKLI